METATEDLVQLLGTLNLSNSDSATPSEKNLIMSTQGFQAEFLRVIPEFNGDPSRLPGFIRASDLIINQFSVNDPTAFINHLLLSSVIQKLTGAAATVTNGRLIHTWKDLKQILKDNFGDQRSEDTLLQDLLHLKQNNESPLTFYNRCQELKAALFSHLSHTDSTAELQTMKAQMYTSLTLKAFLSGLRDPLGSFIRSTEPATLEDALRKINEEQNIRHLQAGTQNQNRTFTRPPMHVKQIPPKQFQPQPNYQKINNVQPRPGPSHQNWQSRPNYVQQTKILPNIPPRQFPGNQFPSQSIKFNYNKPKGTNVFKPTNKPPPYRPTPMDISRTIKHPYIQQSSQPRNFVSQELFYHDQEESDDNEYNQLEEYENYEQEEYENYNFDHNSEEQEDFHLDDTNTSPT